MFQIMVCFLAPRRLEVLRVFILNSLLVLFSCAPGPSVLAGSGAAAKQAKAGLQLFAHYLRREPRTP